MIFVILFWSSGNYFSIFADDEQISVPDAPSYETQTATETTIYETESTVEHNQVESHTSETVIDTAISNGSEEQHALVEEQATTSIVTDTPQEIVAEAVTITEKEEVVTTPTTDMLDATS
jgi:hypothetical protein